MRGRQNKSKNKTLRFVKFWMHQVKAMGVGFVHAAVGIKSIYGDEKEYRASFLADTGAIDSVIPASELDKIGVKREP